jgi:hypothetical protein
VTIAGAVLGFAPRFMAIRRGWHLSIADELERPATPAPKDRKDNGARTGVRTSRQELPGDALRRTGAREAGFGCRACGVPVIEVYDIVEWAADRHFCLEDMMGPVGRIMGGRLRPQCLKQIRAR